MCPATSRGLPSLGCRCMRRPGVALISMMPPVAMPVPGGWLMSASRRSIPQTSSPMTAAARTHIRATAGCTEAVTSLLVPPVERLALWRSLTTRPRAGTDAGVRPWRFRCASTMSSSTILVSGRSCPIPRRGSALTRSTRAAMSCTPSPVTWAGESSAATTRPPTTRAR